MYPIKKKNLYTEIFHYHVNKSTEVDKLAYTVISIH